MILLLELHRPTAVEVDIAPEVEMETAEEDDLGEIDRGFEPADVMGEAETSPELPEGRLLPIDGEQACGRVRMSARWPALRKEILRRATIENMEAHGTGENERRCYEEKYEHVGCSILTLTNRAHLVAAAFCDWHDVDFLPYRVPNYVGPEHMDVMRDEIRREIKAGHIFSARWRLPLGIIALGMVEKLRKGKVKYKPASDYSRPTDVGMNAKIDELDKDEFTTVKEAYGMLRPRY
ncbi:hypothetical protein CYMTET_55601 [Cymbomonas tetramitiformis]|uniref:Uncharacterized protein n=1 Tax=Cymbomonas tetramitiformis TaxID=36881 RepID=A0AAE0ENE1_9CHLO|nr:hypothetical protein CYMTET_55601 [Cymbomonas tetramitiformis]